MSAEKRAKATSAGGKARGATITTAELAKAGKAGAAAIHSPTGLARRLVKRWPALAADERAEVLAILASGGIHSADGDQ